MKFVMKLVSGAVLVAASTMAGAEKLEVIPEQYQVCTVCHGTMLRGNSSTKAPAIAGLQSWYVSKQLTSFKKEWRGKHPQDVPGTEMYPVAAGMSEKEISAAAKFVASLPVPTSTSATVTGDVEAGEKLYSACKACHGGKADGNKLLGAPSLAIQNDWYLKQQLINYRDGIRGSHPEDSKGASMAQAAKGLSGEHDIDNIVAYISTL
ncbi:hypothetical protein MAH4_28240 [Sessilibacter sp. MAH4]